MKNVPIESVMSGAWNHKMFKHIQTKLEIPQILHFAIFFVSDGIFFHGDLLQFPHTWSLQNPKLGLGQSYPYLTEQNLRWLVWYASKKLPTWCSQNTSFHNSNPKSKAYPRCSNTLCHVPLVSRHESFPARTNLDCSHQHSPQTDSRARWPGIGWFYHNLLPATFLSQWFIT